MFSVTSSSSSSGSQKASLSPLSSASSSPENKSDENTPASAAASQSLDHPVKPKSIATNLSFRIEDILQQQKEHQRNSSNLKRHEQDEMCNETPPRKKLTLSMTTINDEASPPSLPPPSVFNPFSSFYEFANYFPGITFNNSNHQNNKADHNLQQQPSTSTPTSRGSSGQNPGLMPFIFNSKLIL